jgi:ribosomal protein L31E
VDKFIREASGVLGEERAKQAVEVVRAFEEKKLSDIRAALSA